MCSYAELLNHLSPHMEEKMNYKIECGGAELLNSVEPLWQHLKIFHKEKSQYFKQDYEAFNFETRKKDLIEKSKRGSLKVALGLDNQDIIVGYCISSIENQEGEIDSIFVIEECRRRGVGAELIEESIKWFYENSVKKIKVNVAYGNEEAFLFYEKFGLYPRLTVLTTS